MWLGRRTPTSAHRLGGRPLIRRSWAPIIRCWTRPAGGDERLRLGPSPAAIGSTITARAARYSTTCRPGVDTTRGPSRAWGRLGGWTTAPSPLTSTSSGMKASSSPSPTATSPTSTWRRSASTAPAPAAAASGTGARTCGPAPPAPRRCASTTPSFTGAWGLNITWNDGHATGIYPFEALRRWSEGRPAFGPDSGLSGAGA